MGDGPARTPASTEALLEKALALHGAGSLGEAARLYEAILAQDGNHAFALALFGLLRAQEGAHAEALGLFDRALRSDPRQVLAHNGKGIALKELKRPEEALACFAEAIRLKPDFAEAYCNRGNAYRDLKRHDDAMADYRKALALSPHLADAHYNLGLTLQDLHRDADALSCFTRAVAINPSYADAHNAAGNSLQNLKRYGEALESYRRAARIKDDYTDAHMNAGRVLYRLGRFEEALAAYKKAAALNPNSADAHHGSGSALEQLKRFDEALESFGRAMALDEHHPNALDRYVYAKMLCCSWSHIEEDKRRLFAAIERETVVPSPFAILTLSDSQSMQRKCADLYVRKSFPAPREPLWRGQRYAHDKIRLGYLSSDFFGHATAFLSAGMFESHDKDRFETYAFSYSRNDGSAVRKRIEACVNRFIDVEEKSDSEIARTVKEMEIDIAVDLKGITQEARSGILAYRPAPVQVAYLGYPGTTAMSWIDYAIADHIVLPPELAAHFSEKIAYLPDTYQCNDSKREIADAAPSRADEGLPETGFVFCSFNNNYKITPYVFDIWMRLLRSVDGSVLWLLEDNPAAARNLRQEATARGIPAERLIFAQRADPASHLARHRLADLFLDTLPCGAHTTASDALWAGLPVLTCAGTTFAGCVAASLLTAIGLPELITSSLEDYEALALDLARTPARLAALRDKLARNRGTAPLFVTDRFTRHLEAAYEMMWRRAQDGLPPESFTVPRHETKTAP